MSRETIKSDRELAIEERRLSLEESFPKKWGSVVFGSLATIIVAILSATATVIVKNIEEANANSQLAIANSRTAIELYFNNFDKFSVSNERTVHKLALVAEISGVDSVKNLFYQMRDDLIDQRRLADAQKSVSDASRGLPSITPSGNAINSNFTVYIHYPNRNSCAEYADSVNQYFVNAGMRVPAMESMPIGSSPNQSEVRYYSTLQKVQLASVPSSLQEETGIAFRDQILPGNLPSGIFEVWIGEDACVT